MKNYYCEIIQYLYRIILKASKRQQEKDNKEKQKNRRKSYLLEKMKQFDFVQNQPKNEIIDQNLLKKHVGFLLKTDINMNEEQEQEIQNDSSHLELEQQKIKNVFKYLDYCSRQNSILFQYQQWYEEKSQNPPNKQEIIEFINKGLENFFTINIDSTKKISKHLDFRNQEIFDIAAKFKDQLFGDVIQKLMKKDNFTLKYDDKLKKLMQIYVTYLENGNLFNEQKDRVEKINNLLQDFKLDDKFVDIADRIIETLENPEDNSKRLKIEDFAIIQIFFKQAYRALYSNSKSDGIINGTLIQKDKFFYVCFMLGYAFLFSQKQQRIEDLMAGKKEKPQDVNISQEEKNDYFIKLNHFINSENFKKLDKYQKLQVLLQYNMFKKEYLFSEIEYTDNMKITTYVEVYLLGLNIIQQNIDKFEDLNHVDVLQKMVFQDIVNFQVQLGNIVSQINYNYLEKDGIIDNIIKSIPEIVQQNKYHIKTYNVPQMIKNFQRKAGIFFDISKQNEQTYIYPVIIPYLRFGSYEFDFTKKTKISYNIVQFLSLNPCCCTYWKNVQYNLILNDDILLQNKFERKHLILPYKLKFCSEGLFYNSFWKNVLTDRPIGVSDFYFFYHRKVLFRQN
ncbi:hypothetical protein TTHERM_00277590 (macronuclear) [Tetrahymena thermophila SB210]|uniref:Uncharacterized protein n=1 Tax=Tetrahymena thermophila (strain SB210) TaxID=312017 RepID=I7M8D5_TETTS|nr:hypothetical protein TTHERM_00277590 [Tetrahymena thermophila SB210]EAR97872.2 hypothetical protein TTHERM_00277590 [Tetrahymena thermophila SB210]|eukprot:XP_001018117.2 hypothetical protein TTHERM_00277590 [Tetrahymena thermophila SB210]